MADIDVVAVLRRMAFQAGAERLSQEDASVPDHRQQSAEDARAIAAVAELIAAHEHHRECLFALARAKYNSCPADIVYLDAERVALAEQRLAAALAACKPATK